MVLRAVLSVTAALLVLPISSGLLGFEWHVDGSFAQSGDGITWETAFQTVQAGMAVASDGDTVIVAESTHIGDSQFKSQNPVFQGMDPTDFTMVEKAVGRKRRWRG